MTDQKMDYIADALSELEDSYVAEAAEYEKRKRRLITWKEAGAAAACIAALFIAVTTFRYLPVITTEEKSAERSEVLEGYREGAMADEAEKENEQEYVVNSTERQKQEIVYQSNGISWEIVKEEKDVVTTDSQIVTESVANAQKENEKGNLGELNIMQQVETKQEASCMEWRSAEDILAEGRDIFLGEVTNLEVYHVTKGMECYFTVAEVRIEEGIRGNVTAGQTCSIYLPVAKVNDQVLYTTSLSGDLEELKIGSKAVFMPERTNINTGFKNEREKAWLCYQDFADYYFSEGMRYLFLETEDGASYAEDVYEIPGGAHITMEDVTAYLKELLQK